jgi:hypothetical protein
MLIKSWATDFIGTLPNSSERSKWRFTLDICSNPEILRLLGKTIFYRKVNSDRALNAKLQHRPLS